MSVIMPAVYLVLCTPEHFDLIGSQLVFGIMHIQVVYYELSAWFEAACNGTDGIIMLAPRPEITETREEVKCIVKVIAPEWQAHVMDIEVEVICFVLFG